MKTCTDLQNLLKKKIISSEDQRKLYIFPFCLFSRKFFIDFKRSLKLMFIGEMNNNCFKLEPSSIIFSTQTNIPLLITGTINENRINLKYSIPNYFLIIISAFVLIVYVMGIKTNELRYMPFLVIFAFILICLIKVIRVNFIFNKICK